MVELKQLEIGREYYHVDSEYISLIKLISFERSGSKKASCKVNFLKCVLDHDYIRYGIIEFIEKDSVYPNHNEIINVNNKAIFEAADYDVAKKFYEELVRANENDFWEACYEEGMSPEGYPDWDGDESLMYLIECCCEEDYEDDGEEDDEF